MLSFRKMSLLLVDSSKMSRDALESSLEPLEFYRLWTAGKTEEAMALLEQKEIHLIICAAKMQPMSGFQLVELVRKRYSSQDLPVIMLLERPDPVLTQKAEQVGADLASVAPLKPAQLRQAVQSLLENRVDLEEEEFLSQMERGRKAMRSKAFAVAEKSFTAALAIKTDELALLSLARIRQQQGDLPGAEKAFMEVMRSYPDSLKAYLSLARMLKQQGRPAQALKVLTLAIKVAQRLKQGGAEQASIYYFMGEIELELKRLKQALALFRKAGEQSPQDAELQVKIGDALARAGHFFESEDFYKRALELAPELANVYNRLAIAYRRQGKYQPALDLYEKARTFRPDDEHLLYNMARCHWEAGQGGQAVELLQQALAINPGFEYAEQFLAAISREMESQADPVDQDPDPPAEELSPKGKN